MKQSDYTVRVLRPDEGYVLTENRDVPDDERTLTDEVFLGVNDSPDQWREIPEAEATAIMEERERASLSRLADLCSRLHNPVPNEESDGDDDR